MVRLALPTPDVVERILDGRPIARLAQLLKPLPGVWEEQQRQDLTAQVNAWVTAFSAAATSSA